VLQPALALQGKESRALPARCAERGQLACHLHAPPANQSRSFNARPVLQCKAQAPGKASAGVIYLQELLPRALAPLHACPLHMLYQTGKHVCVLGCEAGGGCCVHVALSGREQALCLPCARVRRCARAAECPESEARPLPLLAFVDPAKPVKTPALSTSGQSCQADTGCSSFISYCSAPHSHVHRLPPGAPQLVRAGSRAKSRSKYGGPV